MKFALVVSAAAVAAALFTPAMAADLIVEEPVVSAGVVDVGGNWDGFYLGGFVGYGAGDADHVNGDGGPCGPEGCDIDLSGWTLGVTAGANMDVGSGLILGVAGDLAWNDISGDGSFDFFGTYDYESTINWSGALRGVVGFDGGSFMPYLTAGLAVANASHYSEWASDTLDATHVGWTAGVGVQMAVTEDMSIDLRYLHSQYSEETYEFSGGASDPEFGLSSDVVTVGLNFRF
jgi:outer membrane immunogenic protein